MAGIKKIITDPLVLPLYAKITYFIIGMYAFVSILYIAQGIIIPLIFGVLIAIILHPVVNLITRFKINRIIAIAITLILSFAVLAAFGLFMFSQVVRFSESWPELMKRFTEITSEATAWANYYFDISQGKINEWLLKSKGEIIDTNSTEIGKTIINVGSSLTSLLLIPVYVFMLLYYHPLLIEFIRRLFGQNNRNQVSIIISKVKTVIQHYLIGLLIEVAIIATLYTIGLLILGIEYALVLAIIGALLNLIPYLGAILAAALPMIIAIVTKPSPWVALVVLAMYVFIQLIDNNFLVPKIVASKVKINALVSIIIVIAFGTLWGIPGMFLAIPLIAIVKLICDHIEPLKPLGFLLGDSMPEKEKHTSLEE